MIKQTGLAAIWLCAFAFVSVTAFGADPKAKKKPTETSKEPVAKVEDSGLIDRPSSEEVVRLYDLKERGVDAKLLSATGEFVTVERVLDGRVFELAITSLDKNSQNRIYRWIEKNPEVASYKLDFEVNKRFIENDKYETLGKLFKTSKLTYDVVLSNLSRNELRDAEVEYRIVYDDEVTFVRTSAYPGKGEQWEGESAELPPLIFNGRAEFSVSPVTMETYEYYPRKATREYRRDRLIGIWIRVVKEGVLLGEYRSNEAAMANLVWDGEEAQGITFKDSFKDSFDDNK